MRKVFLDQGEVVLEKEIAKGKWVAIPNVGEEMKKYRTYARNTLNKNKKINIRITDWDYHRIRIKAVQEGLPYQTLVSSIIHKYLTGQMKTR